MESENINCRFSADRLIMHIFMQWPEIVLMVATAIAYETQTGVGWVWILILFLVGYVRRKKVPNDKE